MVAGPLTLSVTEPDDLGIKLGAGHESLEYLLTLGALRPLIKPPQACQLAASGNNTLARLLSISVPFRHHSHETTESSPQPSSDEVLSDCRGVGDGFDGE